MKNKEKIKYLESTYKKYENYIPNYNDDDDYKHIKDKLTKFYETTNNKSCMSRVFMADKLDIENIIKYTAFYPSDVTFMNRILSIIHNITELKRCIVCNKPIYNKGFIKKKFCSNKCSNIYNKGQNSITNKKTCNSVQEKIKGYIKVAIEKIKNNTLEPNAPYDIFKNKVLDLYDKHKKVSSKLLDKSDIMNLYYYTHFLNPKESIKTRLYYIKHDIREVVQCKECNITIQPDKTFCSICSSKNDDVKRKIKNTNIKKYGCEYTLQNKDIREKIKKTNIEIYVVENPMYSDIVKNKVKQTNLKKYGHETALCNEDIKNKARETNLKRYGNEEVLGSKIIRDKIKKTNLERYGVEHPLQNKNILKKFHDTCEMRYGSKYPLNNSDVYEKFKINFMENYGVDHPFKTELARENVIKYKYDLTYQRILSLWRYCKPKFTRDEYQGDEIEYDWICSNCETIFTCKYDRHKIPLCPDCFPKHKSYIEVVIENFLMTYGIEYEMNNRSIINPLELDFYIPSVNIALELDGLYWHSQMNGKHRKYHLNKTEKCLKNGVRLIHIFEDEIMDKEDIVFSRLKNILNINSNIKTVYGRKTSIREITYDVKNEFLEKTHIQGTDKSSVFIGLFHDDVLVSVMTFGKSRYNKNYQWELIRYSTLKDHLVVGGAGKLLKYFINNYNPTSIISYADRRWSQGNLYEKLGFNFIRNSKPNYWYTKGYKRESRIKYQKHKLEKLLENFDSQKTEYENMLDNGYDRIWDCGNKVFVMEFDK